MKKTILLYSIIGLMLSLGASAQTDRLSSVNRDYANFSYQDSAEELLKLVRKGTVSKQIYTKLANSYYYIGDMNNASKWYGATLEKYLDNDPELVFRYAQSLKASGNIDASDKIMKQFVRDFPADSRAIKYAKAGDYMKQINNVSEEMVMENLDCNSAFSDFGTAFYKEGIVFASAQGGGRIYNWTNQPYLDLFYQDDYSGSLDEFSSKINTKLHESTPVFTKDGETMYFTRNNYYKRKIGKDENDITLLKIYSAKLVNDKWTDITPLPFNSDEYNVSHPTISHDGRKLYFASNMPGTMGDSDIFVVDINLDDTYGTPQNLGPTINTAGKESFPFVSDQDVLYYSSNGLPGLGGLDVFKYDLTDTSSVPQNMGKPINSTSDDFGFAVDNVKNLGYVSSNRHGGKGDDDIYRFKSNEVCYQEITGKVLDVNTKEVITVATVEISDMDDNLLGTIYSDTEGKLFWKATCANKTYKVKTSKEGYITKETQFKSKEDDTEVELNLDLEPVAPIVVEEPLVKSTAPLAKEGTDLYAIPELDLKPLYFDLNKSTITNQAKIELTKVIVYMKTYPQINIDVRSHTDSRASDAYNMSLSDRRAKATIEYILRVGEINSDRVSGKGYGETKLVNKCADGVQCSEVDHQLNRRSEFIVIK